MPLGVISCELDSAEEVAFVVNCYGVVLLEHLLQVLHVCHFVAKGVDNKAECDGPPHVAPEAWGMLPLATSRRSNIWIVRMPAWGRSNMPCLISM